jgi:Ni/Fe-hydrogenase 1 B-type cytochrome subunit
MPSSTDQQAELFRRIPVWGGWFRLSHWSIALSSLVLMFTGWLVAESPSLAEGAGESHTIAASVLFFGLLLRSLLMFVGKPYEQLTGLIVEASEFKTIIETGRFYLSLGKTALPNWYAQNPLWKTLYLFVYLVLYIQVISGAMMPGNDTLFGFYLPSVHAWWAQVLVFYTALHLAAVVLHDYRGKAADVSAMINGHRLFQIGGNQTHNSANENIQIVTLDLSKHK